MIDTVKEVGYKAFGFNISSDIPLSELPQINLTENQVNIEVKITDLSQLWSQLAIPNQYFVVKEDMVLFHVPDVAIYLVKNGQEIMVDPIKGSHEDQIRLYILGTCMGALLIQRGILPLHGSAIAIEGKAYAIVGDSGAGKSTLASAFLKRGYQLLSDDVIPVTLSMENIPIVTPAYPQQKLWLESLNQFGMESTELRPIIERETKFAVPVSAQFVKEPMPLAGVFELIKTDKEDIAVFPNEKMERFYTIFSHTYRNFIVTRAGLMEWHFGMSAKMMKHLEIYQLHRPTSRFTAHELVDLILTRINKGEKIT
ncbi:aldolase [Oceanobacillus sp. 143]|uniref:Aldolase n=1 Tax=Oceanobacillus zhaokaii TaxID=2052660 RepID=A0A345PL85_9BACI|nr:aldolase [Oceanobacillus zhaokaii]AXI10765.1 aldolase [Oceanobacillus zhaokaii]QGS69680.1 aldolase [Oceanobacillus sp. 143]